MSKPVKKMMIGAYRERFGQTDGALLVDVCGVKSNANHLMRSELAKDDIRITVVKNSLAKQVVADTPLEGLGDLLSGPNAFVYGGESVVHVARKLIALAKEVDNLSFKGAVMEGQVFAADQIEALSKYPTREEAQAKTITAILTPGRNLAGAILGPGRKVASLVKAIQDKAEAA